MSDNELRGRIKQSMIDALSRNYGGGTYDDAAQAVINDLGLEVEWGANFAGEEPYESNRNLTEDEADSMTAWNPGMSKVSRLVGQWQ